MMNETIEKYFNTDLDNLLNDMAQYVDTNTKETMHTYAIRNMAQAHNSDFTTIEEHISSPRAPSVWGGKYAQEYYRLLRQAVEDAINGEKQLLHEAICINFKYCHKKKTGILVNEEYSMAIAVADAIFSFCTGLPFPVIMVSIYCIKKGLLDEWCNCG